VSPPLWRRMGQKRKRRGIPDVPVSRGVAFAGNGRDSAAGAQVPDAPGNAAEAGVPAREEEGSGRSADDAEMRILEDAYGQLSAKGWL